MQITEYQSFCAGNDWTEAFEKAIQEIRAQGGGTLNVPPGRYETRSIELTGEMTLNVESGAYILFSNDIDAYEKIEIDFEGRFTLAAKPLLYARNCKNITITGRGTLDGNGARWWKTHRAHELEFARPYLVCFDQCENVLIENLSLVNSPVWTVHPLRCDRVVIRNLTIRNPKDSPNTDGIDPDYSRNVLIEGCLIDVGDDCIAIKSGTEEASALRATENVIISNCTMLNGHGGLVLGSEMSGDIRNVTLTNCVFQNTDRGIRIKTRRGRGGKISNVMASHVLMDGVLCPLVINTRYFCGKNGKAPVVSAPEFQPFTERTPVIEDISLSDIVCRECASAAGYIEGLPESTVKRVSIRNMTVNMKKTAEPSSAAMSFSCPSTSGAGFILKCVEDACFSGVRLNDVQGEKLVLMGDASADWES